MFESVSLIIASLSGASWLNLKLSGSIQAKLFRFHFKLSNSFLLRGANWFLSDSRFDNASLLRMNQIGRVTIKQDTHVCFACLLLYSRSPVTTGNSAARILQKDIYCLGNRSQSVYDRLATTNRKMPVEIFFFFRYNNCMSRHMGHVVDALWLSQMK